jgi:hypothetical protein
MRGRLDASNWGHRLALPIVMVNLRADSVVSVSDHRLTTRIHNQDWLERLTAVELIAELLHGLRCEVDLARAEGLDVDLHASRRSSALAHP